MDRLNDIKHLVKTGFRESDQWLDWYFGNVFDGSCAMTAVSSSQTVSCLMLDRYTLKLGDSRLPMAYLSCATTRHNARGQGHMRRLICDALMEAASRGDALVTLFPASERLYFYYDRFGFATVFYVDSKRYTSLHRFDFDNQMIEIAPCFEDFNYLEELSRSRVVHNSRNFDNILTDNTLDSGVVIALGQRDNGPRKAMLFAVPCDNYIRVKDLLATDRVAADSALAVLHQRVGQQMIIVDGHPGDNPVVLNSRGMARIVDVESLLSTLAAANPSIEQVIRVRDPILSANNARFIVRNGSVERTSSSSHRTTLEVSIDTLAKIIFNSRRVGDTFGLPSFRPMMSLMLE